ncbi:DUF7344 domain-containing protein [Haloferax profundi]|uniref:DUF7344 domain-containing protein n=1 Tax=Haloferax profundi TaxID=1544718 RepID=A0A0W1S2S0_9EURY|nr:hypothetical protein [Haloferax profundi]KTG20131.1 hypothetical protein AUR66_17795 [Haloferax profundi]
MSGSTPREQNAPFGVATSIESVDDSVDPPTRDDVFEALSNRRRRYALHHLKRIDGDEPVELSEISRQVAAWELGTDPRELSYDDRKNVHTSLYQFHAPKMDELGLVQYDQRGGTVELTEYGREIDVYLETVSEEQIPWSVYFFLLSAGMIVLVGAAWADLFPFSTIPDIAWAEVVASLFLLSSAAFVYHSRYSMRVGNDGPPPEVEE